MMRAATGIFGIVVMAAVATGCGTESATESKSTTTTTTTAATTTLRRGDITDQDRAFLAQLEDYWTESTNRADLLQAGETACARMREGQKLEVIAALSSGRVEGGAVVGATGENLSHAANLIHAAAVAYCPDQLTGVR